VISGNEVTTETSTDNLAREIHRSSWRHNEGRRVEDIPLFDALPEEAKIHLRDTACAGEVMMWKFRDENELLLQYNMALVLFDAYHMHPYGPELPPLDFQEAPTDMKRLWMAYAKDFIDHWWLVKDKPQLQPNIKIEVSER
jgi:hypothetical protein